MKTQSFKKICGIALALSLCAALTVNAQQRPGGFGGGGFGGFGGFGGGGAARANSGSSSMTQYNNNGTVGNAVISVDPVTHNLIVIADEETSQQISNVIANLDAPEPQVLIKVVFVEVDDNKASAIGVQGNYTGVNNNFSQITGFTTNLVSSTTTGSGSSATTVNTTAPHRLNRA